MTPGKRTALAFCCMLFSIALFGVVGTLSNLRYGLRFVLPVLEIMPVYALVAVPGCVLALPFVLLFKNANGYRAWVILAIGTAIGPAFMGTWSYLASGGRPTWQQEGTGLVMSLWIGIPTTILYIVLLRRLTRKPATSSFSLD